ncbi:DUF6415 family natural product biosynthesis protein [Streptomyces sp. NPDC021020]|uniref:DUF6415 family natural product biosynthesis protein n=1 Tax=Streptomyces sp. NPDC021020 TaxID=3365109 RepID=UPI0037A2CE01
MSGPPLANAAPAPNEVGKGDGDSTSVDRLLADLRKLSLSKLTETPTTDAIFDGLEKVLGEHAVVARADMPVLARRLHAVFRRLVHLSQIPGSGVQQETVAASWGLLTELMPKDGPGALGYLRRLAMTVSDLLDELLEDMS